MVLCETPWDMVSSMTWANINHMGPYATSREPKHLDVSSTEWRDVENGNSSAFVNDGHAARQPDAARAFGDDRGVLGEIDGCSVSV